jgi:hypothetical protein
LSGGSTEGLALERIRQVGGGGKRIEAREPLILEALNRLVEPTSRGEPECQFHHIARQVEAFQQQHRPVISIDTKKKENLGQFKNGGQEWLPKGEPIPVKTHDFPDKTQGKAIPYGIDDLTHNQGLLMLPPLPSLALAIRLLFPVPMIR